MTYTYIVSCPLLRQVVSCPCRGRWFHVPVEAGGFMSLSRQVVLVGILASNLTSYLRFTLYLAFCLYV